MHVGERVERERRWAITLIVFGLITLVPAGMLMQRVVRRPSSFKE